MISQRALAFFVAVPLAGLCHAGITFRFTGSIGERIADYPRVNESFDRSDAGGQGDLRLDESPPAFDISRHFRATASAGFGYLTGSSHVEYNKGWAGGGNYADYCSAGTYSFVSFDDVVIPGPPGWVFVSANAHISGMHIAGASVNANAESLVQPSFYVNDSNVGGGYHSVYVSGGNTQVTQFGCMVGFTGSNTITSDGFFVQANVPFKLGIAFSTSTGVSCNYDNVSNGVANADYSSTMTLPVNSPVFNLPPGYTASSAQAGISNNLYTPPCPCDFNHDNQVDDADFIAFVYAYNILDCADPAMSPGCPVDVNYDSAVDDADFTIFVAAYNELLCP